jgi:hypothetical protein
VRNRRRQGASLKAETIKGYGDEHRNDSADHADTPVARRFAELAPQQAWGYYPSGGIGLILLLIIVLLLLGRL